MGQVYLARTTGAGDFERHVVLKLLDVDADERDPRVAMFLDEARVLGRMHHHHIAPAFAVGRDRDGRHYLAMDYVHGRSAAEVWDRTLDLDAALPIDFAITVVAAAASALHYAHTRTAANGSSLSIVHRDVSLSNVMIGYDGAIKLIDFGIAKAADSSTMTQAGFIKGKVGYLAPEQVSYGAIDRRTDIFGLGIVLYELTTMTRAFRERDEAATIERIRKCNYVLPSRVVSGFPRALELIIARALQRDPTRRFPDADSMRRELEAFGMRHRLVLGESAIVEVMAQLFEDRREPWLVGRPHRLVDTTIDRAPERPGAPRSSVRALHGATEVIELTVRKGEREDDPTTPNVSRRDTRERVPRSGSVARAALWLVPLVVSGLAAFAAWILMRGGWSD